MNVRNFFAELKRRNAYNSRGRRLQPFWFSGRIAKTVTVPPITGVLIRALFTCERQGSGQHFAFLIPPEKAEQARSALVARGFPEETMQQDDGFSVYVRDPDGNKIELYGKRTTGA